MSADPKFREFMDFLRKTGLDFTGRFFSIYRADVTEIVPGIRGEVKVWAKRCSKKPIRALPLATWGGKGYAQFFPPDVGDKVLLMFEDGNQDYPLYIGGWWADGWLPDDFRITAEQAEAGSFPVRGWITKSGLKILLDETEEGEEKIALVNGDSYIEVQGSKVVIEGTEIDLGTGSLEWAAKGETLVKLMAAILDAIIQMTHPAPGGVTGPPANAGAFAAIKEQLDTLLSGKTKVE